MRVKLVFFCSFIFLSIFSQNKITPWLVSLGVTSQYYTGLPSWKTDYISPYLMISRYAEEGFSLGSQITTQNIIDESKQTNNTFKFIGADGILNYDLNRVFLFDKFHPYVNVGLGMTSVNELVTFNTLISLGTTFWLNEKFGLNAQVSNRNDFLDKGLDSYQVHFGISYHFGVADGDGDGVFDKIDVCPNNFGLVHFNGCPDFDNDGVEDIKDDCPETVGIIELGGCPDKDLDNVPDNVDNCPEEPGDRRTMGCPDIDKDTLIDKEDWCPKLFGDIKNGGCPWSDRDNDKVPDKDDKCPNKKGSVATFGCPEKVTKELQKTLNEYAKVILFDTGTANIKPQSKEVLIAISNILKDFPYAYFIVEGHTDNVGNDNFNMQISLERATAVMNELIKEGIPIDRLSVKGYGERRPISTNTTEDGRKQNRRVEINLVSEKL